MLRNRHIVEHESLEVSRVEDTYGYNFVVIFRAKGHSRAIQKKDKISWKVQKRAGHIIIYYEEF